jgi:NAD(P) transhydrogenase subunit alpha
MVAAMAPGSVIVDLAAERGGNCELTRKDEVVTAHGVTILGPTDLVSRKPHHASQMFSKNVETFLRSLVKEGELVIDPEDEVTAGTLLCRDGEVVHPRVRELLGLSAPSAPEAPASPEGE